MMLIELCDPRCRAAAGGSDSDHRFRAPNPIEDIESICSASKGAPPPHQEVDRAARAHIMPKLIWALIAYVQIRMLKA